MSQVILAQAGEQKISARSGVLLPHEAQHRWCAGEKARSVKVGRSKRLLGKNPESDVVCQSTFVSR